MDFTKLQGAGNDFILIEAGGIEKDWSQLAEAVCNRRFGVGADGLLLLLPSDAADFGMRIFNSDGSEAEACGNGLRCLVRYILSRELLTDPEAEGISIETIAGIRTAVIKRKGKVMPGIQVGLGSPRFKASEIPVMVGDSGEEIDIKLPLDHTITVDNREMPLRFVSMGNPHAIYFTDQPVGDFPLVQLGPEVEHHKIFPQRTNFEVARVLNYGEIEARVWERGVGETPACGSGAVSIAVAARLLGLTSGDTIDIKLPGGVLTVTWPGSGEALLSGPAEIVFTGIWPVPLT